MLSLLDAEFNESAADALTAIKDTLRFVEGQHDPQQWHAALAVYVGTAIHAARKYEGMPMDTAKMLVDCIRDYALNDEIQVDA